MRLLVFACWRNVAVFKIEKCPGWSRTMGTLKPQSRGVSTRLMMTAHNQAHPHARTVIWFDARWLNKMECDIGRLPLFALTIRNQQL